MDKNQKLSEALKGNTNAAKNHVKKFLTSGEKRVKNAWEAIDKTVKYGAAGAVAGATGVGLLGIGSPFAKKVSLPISTAAYGTAGGISGAVIGNGATTSTQTRSQKRKTVAIAAGTSGGASALANLAAVASMRALGTPTPAKLAAGALIGGAIGAYRGYKLDRKEAAERKIKG